MSFKSLDKAKSLTTPRTQIMGLHESNPCPHGNLVKLNETIGRILEVK
jgi:hypothetical protein